MSYGWNFPEFDNNNSQIQGRAAVFFILVLFSIIFLFTYLFIYVRWLFRPFPPHPSHAPPPPPPPGGLNSAKITTMPIVLYEESGEFSEAECCICLGIFGSKDKVKIMGDCKHCFHSECVDKWLKVHSSCPLCRSLVRVDSPV